MQPCRVILWPCFPKAKAIKPWIFSPASACQLCYIHILGSWVYVYSVRPVPDNWITSILGRRKREFAFILYMKYDAKESSIFFNTLSQFYFIIPIFIIVASWVNMPDISCSYLASRAMHLEPPSCVRRLTWQGQRLWGTAWQQILYKRKFKDL